METLKFKTDSIRIEGAVRGGVKITFFTKDLDYRQDLLHKYEGRLYDVKIEPHRDTRSLDANAYMWTLLGKESQHKEVDLKKDELYLKAIKDYGVWATVPLADDLVEDICRWHDKEGQGNRHEILGKSKAAGYTNVTLYYGSSGYNTKQMSCLIDGIIRDCKELGIETKSKAEIERMMAQWGEELNE